jgi:Fe-S cluster biogenesis protein NfuA
VQHRVAEVEETLRPLTRGLEADGYGVEVAEESGRLQLRVIAREGACEDCLVPRSTMLEIISGRLGHLYARDDIDIQYPPSSAAG